MSLINDALKRAEKSLNNNSADQPRDPIPSFDFEPSGKNKKLFLIFLIGGTLFLTVLILLIVLLNSSPEPSTSTPLPSTASTPTVIPEISIKEELAEIPDETQAQEPSEAQNEQVSETFLENPKVSPPLTPKEASTPGPINLDLINAEVQKDLNKDLLHGMVNLASRAFIGSQPADKESDISEEIPETNYQLSTSGETLAKLEKEASRKDKIPTAPETPIQSFIRNLSVTGVMISPDASQVLINNKVYSNRWVIDESLNLRLIDIQPHVLTIQDATGKTYTKEF